MRITLFMTAALNGIIARPDFREDFLSRQNWDSFLECVRRTGALIWGRRTHEKVRKYGPQYFEPMEELRKVVVTGDDRLTLEPGFERAGSPEEAVRLLEAHGLAEATLAGGSILNTAFARAGLIDVVEMNVEAVVVGRGIPLFAPADFDLKLDLEEVRRLDDRIFRVRCAVRKC